MMKGQSSSWFFIEELSIGMLSINVTLQLSSKMAHDPATSAGAQSKDRKAQSKQVRSR